MAQKLNYIFTRGCDLLLWPLRTLAPFWGIFFLSLLTSLFVLAVYRLVSDAQRVKDTKNRIKAHILAIRLYRDFWKVIVVSFFKSLFYTAKYFVLNLLPLLLVLPLMFLLFVQMDVRYGMRPYRVGEEIVVRAGLDRDVDALDIELQADPHFRATMNPVFVKALREVDWKLRAVRNGAAAIVIRVGGQTVRKDLVVGETVLALSNKKMADSGWDHFINPVEKRLAPRTPVRFVTVRYPARSVPFLGFRTHWLVIYLALTMVIALALKNRFGVEF
jgi:hypothetical protein